ncbi:MAG: helix-turn-helix domain-containing protein [Candidatus Solibacter sp.]
MRYEEYAPSPDLKRWITCHWVFAVPPDVGPLQHVAPPDGTVTFAYVRRIRTVILIGPALDAMKRRVYPADEVWGVRFEPGVSGALLGLDIPKIRGVVTPLDFLLPGLAARLNDRLCKARSAEEAAGVFEDVVHGLNPAELDSAIVGAARALVESTGSTPIAKLATDAHLSERQFRRRFHAAIGLLPKEFARVRRARAALVQMLSDPHERLTGVAAGVGYADQSHLTREFVTVFGGPPTSVAERLRRIHHQNAW